MLLCASPRSRTTTRSCCCARGTPEGCFTSSPLCFPRDAHYTPELLLYAWHNRTTVLALEAQLQDFLRDATKKRVALPPAPRPQRQVAHELAAQYGLATQSFGSEPARHIQLFKARALFFLQI